ncbi:sulfotransferase family protein [Shewanella algidipiscicola]|uniref:Sulfotransferase n=1 Tax=Shewanella algidipiscicola TaxID=614070 RepID=A0ABQ4NTA6_9GAMM|nr:sulfotransferase [Shewanella algidipiscicola]GIU02816.1 hypothetical protein TUM4630_35220 [Shewanella algidipiscicola]
MWKPLFICGCPRSGTSALRNVFNADPRFALGMERYYSRGSTTFSLKREHFSKSRFYDLQEGDTFWASLDNCSSNKSYFDDSIYRGDKIPLLYKHLQSLFIEMPDSTVLFIVRDIYEVAASYNVRAKDENDSLWARNQDFKVAVDDWNESLVHFYQSFQERKEKVIPIFFDDFFSNEAALDVIFRKLGLNNEYIDFVPFVSKYIDIKTKKKDTILSYEEKNYISENANLKLLAWLKEKFK